MSALPTIYENPVIALNEDRADFINDYFHLLERVQVKEKSINREMVETYPAYHDPWDQRFVSRKIMA